MEKLTNYIKNGKGLGFLFLLATSVIMTIFIMFSLKQTYAQMYPQITKAADEMLPIMVSNGKIVSPENTYKKIEINLGEYEGKTEIFPIVLDTQSETSIMPKAENGIFIMRDVIYIVMQDEVRRMPLQDGEFNQTMLKSKMDSLLSLSSFFVATVLIFLFFAFTLIKTLILALLSRFLVKIKRPENLWSFDILMRLSAIVVSSIELICFVLNLCGLPIIWFCQFIVEIVLIVLFVNREIGTPQSLK